MTIQYDEHPAVNMVDLVGKARGWLKQRVKEAAAFAAHLVLAVPSMSILNPGIRIFRKPKPAETRGKRAGFWKERWLTRMDKESTP